MLMEDGLNNTSLEWVKYRSYYDAQVLYKDDKLSDFNAIRSLVSTVLNIRNINYQNNRLTFTTNIPENFDYHKSFQIVFLETLYSAQNVTYYNETTTYAINQHPELLK